MFFELFADTGAKERGPELGPSLTKPLKHCGAGKHVLCEKPVGMNLAELLAMKEVSPTPCTMNPEP